MSLSTILSSVVVLLILMDASAAVDIGFNETNPIRMVSDGLQEVEESIVQILGQSRHVLSFARFTHRYGKRYENAEEIKLRFSVFKENLDLIRSTNKKGLSYKLGVNQFADLTWQEFQKTKLGAGELCYLNVKGSHKLTEAALPETKDWREDGIVGYVKEQGLCGSSWAFSATGALEAAHHQAFGKAVSLSEQQLVDCAWAFANFGCNSGLPSHAFLYIKEKGGLEKEDDYPYYARDGPCLYSSEYFRAQILDVVDITPGAEDELKHAVGLVRPVSVAFEAKQSLLLYKSGVYTDSHCGNIETDVNHAVLAVGYGIEDGVPYWLLKNSWGPDWGDEGYFKMEMGKNMCGIATCASYPVVV